MMDSGAVIDPGEMCGDGCVSVDEDDDGLADTIIHHGGVTDGLLARALSSCHACCKEYSPWRISIKILSPSKSLH